MRLKRTALTATLIFLIAGPVLAYTIYLRDGSTLLARTKFEIQGDKAIIILQNGTQTFIQASEIDIPRCERENQVDYGAALVLEDGKFLQRRATQAPPKEDTLVDLARRARPTSGQAATNRAQETRPETQAPSNLFPLYPSW